MNEHTNEKMCAGGLQERVQWLCRKVGQGYFEMKWNGLVTACHEFACLLCPRGRHTHPICGRRHSVSAATNRPTDRSVVAIFFLCHKDNTATSSSPGTIEYEISYSYKHEWIYVNARINCFKLKNVRCLMNEKILFCLNNISMSN